MKEMKPLVHHPYLRTLLAGVLCYGVFIFMLASFTLVTTPNLFRRSSKAADATPAVIPLTGGSQVGVDGAVVTNDVTIPASVSFSSDQTSLPGALDILNTLEDTKFKETAPASNANSQVQGDSTNLQVETTTALPADFTKNAKLIRTLDEKQAYPEIAQDHVKHYYFQQQIPVGNEKLPVLGAEVRMGLKEEGGKSDLLNMTSSVVSSTKVQTGPIDNARAESSALSLSNTETNSTSTQVCAGTKSEKVIVNKKLLGISEDDTNVVAYRISVCGEKFGEPYDTDMYVSQQTGQPILTWSNLWYALNREIHDCQGSSSQNCPIARREGESTGGTGDVAIAYDFSKNIYDYYFFNHSRDSYDNRGSKIVGSVNMSMKNAMSGGYPNKLYFGKGFVTNDVWAHEFTHSVTQATAGLGQLPQAAALNEGFSDVFGWAVDPTDWLIGEDVVINGRKIGYIRRMDSPDGQPDRMFSSKYNTADSHINAGILNKAFYLMVQGGTFNNCTVQGSDSKKVLQVMYKTLTTYLRTSSNFRDVYTQANKACGELFGASSSECVNIKKAMQATEMSLQMQGTQSRQRDPAGETCSGGASGPVPTSSATPVPTNVINPGGGRTVPITNTPIFTPIPTIRSQSNPTGAPNVPNTTTTPETTATPSATFTATPEPASTASATMTIDIYAKLQGITDRVPDPIYQPLKFKLKLVSTTNPDKVYEYTNVAFTASQVRSDLPLTSKDGVLWYSRLTVAIPAGNYYLYIKGPKHVQNRIGDLAPTETAAGRYTSKFQGMRLKAGDNLIDLSGITLFSGDLPNPNQDGVINSTDLLAIQDNLGKSTPEALKLCDLNLDGVCNGLDYKQVLDALANRFDIE